MKYNHYSINNHQGFTLIEILVAAVILFSVIATANLVYRGAFLTSEKAEFHATVASLIPSIMTEIQQDIRKSSLASSTSLSGAGKAWKISYSWQAKIEKRGAAPKKLDSETGLYLIQPEKYLLWLVTLNVTYKNKTQSFSYKELSWNAK